MSNKLFIILRDNKMIVKISNQEELVEYPFTMLKSYPNIPFYVNIFEVGPIHKEIKSVVNNNIKSTIKKISKPEIFVLIDDDAMGIEKRAIDEFMRLTFSPKKIVLIHQHALLPSNDKNEYISVSKTSRLLVISYINNGKILAQEFIDNKNCSVDELNKIIKNLHNDCRYRDLEIFLNGIHLKEYSHIGHVIQINELLQNAEEKIAKIKI